MTYTEITNNIRIEVSPRFETERSHPLQGFYLYSYLVRITNLSDEDCQLLNRHWIIIDGNRREEHVHGEGVVGEQPIIRPQGSYEYESYCPLPTPTGNMRGNYLMRNANGKKFIAKIPLFFLRKADIPVSDNNFISQAPC